MEKAPLGTTAEYNRPSGAVRTEEGRRIESGSVGKHEWSFGKRGSGMTQEVLGALPELGSRAGRAVLRWNKASRLMRRKTSTDMVNLNYDCFGDGVHVFCHSDLDSHGFCHSNLDSCELRAILPDSFDHARSMLNVHI